MTSLRMLHAATLTYIFKVNTFNRQFPGNVERQCKDASYDTCRVLNLPPNYTNAVFMAKNLKCQYLVSGKSYRKSASFVEVDIRHRTALRTLYSVKWTWPSFTQKCSRHTCLDSHVPRREVALVEIALKGIDLSASLWAAVYILTS